MTILTVEARQLYESNGYAIIPGGLSLTDLAPMRGVLQRVVDDAAERLHAAGDISSTYEEVAFEQRFPLVSDACDGKSGIHWEHDVFTRELYELATHPAILEAIKPLLGEDIIFNGDFHIRPKLPGSSYFPWHQDSQYYGQPTETMHIITVWVPFVNVHERNGCLSMLPGSHRWGLMESARDEKREMRPAVDPETRGRQVVEPMQAGDLMLFHNLTYHQSLPNPSDGARWSVDLRYSAAPRKDMPETEQEGYRFFLDKLRGLGFLTFTASGANKTPWAEVERNYAELRESLKRS
ncbi:phytanoyl-CoA dioxygenase family protein [Paenibacillus koleovorans]|uniref:phytanoyl-CoA dioxygenase family protein n=1 Tax=Paenibacillus koleovorans TaxID=121608 RepID=UPI000FDC65D2|nr:phytanoyl-CoA dioxygenase family protein [Paenibacillus koleovorans]